jgi:hypothetical protein
MAVYIIVLRGTNSDEDAMSWVAANVDTDVMNVIAVKPSAFLGNYIVRLESTLSNGDYTEQAFEGSLNYEMNDPMSDVVWWNRR